MKYADYDFYKEKYNGTLTASLFDSYIVKASREIDKNVNRKLKEKDITDEVKYVACELVDFLNDNKMFLEKKIASVSNDGVSETYTNISKDDLKSEKRKILDGLPHDLTRYL